MLCFHVPAPVAKKLHSASTEKNGGFMLAFHPWLVPHAPQLYQAESHAYVVEET